MSHSYRKRPFRPFVGHGSQKEDKQRSSRKRRRCTKFRIRTEGEDVVPLTQRDALNTWDMSYDGSKGYQSLSRWLDRGSTIEDYNKYVHRK